MKEDEAFIRTLDLRERYRDEYRRNRDPIADDRLLWRAQGFRHKVHLLPNQTILELGCGQGHFARQLVRCIPWRESDHVRDLQCVRRPAGRLAAPCGNCAASSLLGTLQGRRFDFIVAMDLLDKRNCAWMMQKSYDLLEPGGQILFYESNPLNLFLKVAP